MTLTESSHLGIEQLSALLDNQLAQDERRVADQHLTGCESCAASLAELRATVLRLRQLPPVAPPRSFALTVAARPSLTPWLVPLTGAMSAVAALLFVALVSVELLGGAGASPLTGSPPAEPRAAALQSAPLPTPAAGKAGSSQGRAEPAVQSSAERAMQSGPASAGSGDEAAERSAVSAGASVPAAPSRPDAAAAPTTAAPVPSLARSPASQPTLAGPPLRAWQIASGGAAVALLLLSYGLGRWSRRAV